jgi:hypothetical protein
MERPTSGSSRAGLGSAGRIAKLTDPDRAILESPSSGLERTRATWLDPFSTRIH